MINIRALGKCKSTLDSCRDCLLLSSRLRFNRWTNWEPRFEWKNRQTLKNKSGHEILRHFTVLVATVKPDKVNGRPSRQRQQFIPHTTKFLWPAIRQSNQGFELLKHTDDNEFLIQRRSEQIIRGCPQGRHLARGSRSRRSRRGIVSPLGVVVYKFARALQFQLPTYFEVQVQVSEADNQKFRAHHRWLTRLDSLSPSVGARLEEKNEWMDCQRKGNRCYFAITATGEVLDSNPCVHNGSLEYANSFQSARVT